MNNKIKWIITFLLSLQAFNLHSAETISPLKLLKQNKQSYVFPDKEIPTLASPAIQNKKVSAEILFEQKLWNLLSAGKLSTLKNKISQRQKLITGWKPPAWLTVELARAQLNKKINAVRENPKKLIRFYALHPEAFSCRLYYNLWSLADAYQSQSKISATKKIHQQILSQCRNPKTLLITLDRVVDTEGKMAALAAVTRILKRKNTKKLTRKLYQRKFLWSSQRAIALREDKKFKQAFFVLASIKIQILRRRDKTMARITAWNYLDLKENRNAIIWFKRISKWSGNEKDYLNLLQTQWLEGERSLVVEKLIKDKILQQKKNQQWAANVLRAEAATQYKANNHAASISLLDTALEYDSPEPVGTASLRGWAYYLSRQYKKSFISFSDAYRRALTIEEEKSAVNGLLHSTYQSKKWLELINLSKEKSGLLLNNKDEREVIDKLASGSLLSSQISVKNGRFEILPEAEVSFIDQALDFVEGVPGYTWGEIRSNAGGRSTVSYLVNQGIDWVVLPGNIMLNTFVEYRAINNDWQLLNEETEGLAGIDLYHKPFHAGVEYILDPWRVNSAGRYYLSWYHDWYKYMRRRRMRDKNWLDVDAYTGSTYGRISHEFTGGTTFQGYVTQGVDWLTFENEITLNTSVSYRFRFRSLNNVFYDAHGPVIAVELQKSPFALGIDYSWSISPPRGTTEETLGIYFKWYYGWNLK